jgi:hypothetical protein
MYRKIRIRMIIDFSSEKMAKKTCEIVGSLFFSYLVENSPSHVLLDTYILRKSRNKKDKYSFDLQLVGDTTLIHRLQRLTDPQKS